MPQNLYEILGLTASNTVTSSEIRNAFRMRSLVYHPDKNPNSKDAHGKMVDINHAYDVLFHEGSRAAYDRQLHYKQPSGLSATEKEPRGKTPKRQAKRHTKLALITQQTEEAERRKRLNLRNRVYGANGRESKREALAAELGFFVISDLYEGNNDPDFQDELAEHLEEHCEDKHIDHDPAYSEFYANSLPTPEVKIQAKTKLNPTRDRKSTRKQRVNVTLPERLGADVKRFIVDKYACEVPDTDLYIILKDLEIEQFNLKSTKWSSRNGDRQEQEPEHSAFPENSWEDDMRQTYLGNAKKDGDKIRNRIEKRQQNIMLEKNGYGNIVRLLKNKRKPVIEMMVSEQFQMDVAHQKALKLM